MLARPVQGESADQDAPVRQASERTVVLVSPYFPPSSVAGVHRARHLAKHLPAAGWKPIVLCVHESHHQESLDPGLAALVPETVETAKVAALPAKLTRPFGVGDLSLRAWHPLKRALVRLLSVKPVDAVMITGSPYYPMLFASEIRRRFKVPVVLDFQDPWVSAWGAVQRPLSKAGLSHRLATILEPRALRAADFVTSVSDIQNEETAARYPWLDGERMAAIPIGGDPDDFTALRDRPPYASDGELDPSLVHLAYVGTFLPRSDLLVRVLFRALALLRSQEPALASRIRLHFIGTSNQADENLRFRVRPIADELGVADSIHEIPRRLQFLAALSWLVRSQGILLIGSDEPHYTASKIYPGLMSGRPFLSLFHRASSAHAILTAAGGGRALSFTTRQELEALDLPLAEGLRTLALGPETLGTVDRAAYAPYVAHNIAARFAGIFDRLVAERGG